MLHEKSGNKLFSKAALLMPLANPLPQLKEAGFFSLEEMDKTICVKVDRIFKYKRVNAEPNKLLMETSAWPTLSQSDVRYWIEIEGDLAVVLRLVCQINISLSSSDQHYFFFTEN
jgi:hypothetical protein